VKHFSFQLKPGHGVANAIGDIAAGERAADDHQADVIRSPAPPRIGFS
jgi:hypothetical protein